MSTFASYAIQNRDALKRYILLKLGAPIVTVELSDDHLEMAIDDACELFSKFANIDQQFLLVNLDPYVTNVGITLPSNVVSVTALAKDFLGGDGMNIYAVDASIAYSMMNNQSPITRTFSLVTFEIAKQYIDLVNMMTGKGYDFNFNDRTKVLTLYPDPKVSQITGTQFIIVTAHIVRPEEQIYGENWVKCMALAQAKIMLGTIRKKFNTVQLLGGGTVDASIGEEGIVERDKLIEDLRNSEAPLMMFYTG